LKRELKNLLNQLSDFHAREGSLFSRGIEWCILYIFLRRYKDVQEDLNLEVIDVDIKKYRSKETNNLYPYDDIFKPIYNFIIEKNSNLITSSDIDECFNKDGKLSGLEPSEVFLIEDLIRKSGIHNFKLDTYSIQEFDQFYIELVKRVTKRSGYRIGELNSGFARLINDIKGTANVVGKDKVREVYIGDPTAQIAFDSNDKQSKKIITGESETVLWYYFRVLLTGSKFLNVDPSNLRPLLNEGLKFIFLRPPIGKLDKDFFKKYGIGKDNSAKYWEILYSNLGIDHLSETGKAILMLPSKVLYRSNKHYKEFRKEIVDSGFVRTIIKLPKGIVGQQSFMEYVLFEIDKKSNSNYVKFIDGSEITSFVFPKKEDEYLSFVKELKNNWTKGLGFYPYVNRIKYTEIEERNYSLAFSNFFNVSYNAEKFKRNEEEEILSLTEVLKKAKQPSKKIEDKAPYIGITQLSDNLTSFQIELDDLPTTRKPRRLKELNSSAILIGKIVGSIKPSFIELNNQSVFLASNVLAFEIPDHCSIEYVIQELRSDFVQKQFRKIESGYSIPSIRESGLKNIFLRIPPLDTQKELVAQHFSEIARNKIEEIENLNADKQYIEKDVFSSFAHDFGKIIANARASVEVIEGYIIGLIEREVISMNDSVFFEEVPDKGERVKDILQQLIRNQDRVQQALQNEVEYFTSDKTERYKNVDLREVIDEWVDRQVQDNYVLNYLPDEGIQKVGEDGNPQYIEGIPVFETVYIEANEEDVYSILNNFLSNAKDHGFTDKAKKYEFIIVLVEEQAEKGLNVVLHIGNNGLPFPEDYSCEDFFRLNHKGPNSNGLGMNLLHFGGHPVKP